MAIKLFDFESRSKAKLSGPTGVGGRNYWEHPSTEAIVCVVHNADTGERDIWTPGDPSPIGPEDIPAAHNASGFDRFGGIRLGWFGPERPWIDTSELGRRAGLPGSLAALASRWLGQRKDDAGTAIVRALSGSPVTGDSFHKESGKLKKRGVPEELIPELREYSRTLKKAAPGTWPEIPAATLLRTFGYCGSDVDVLEHGWPHLAQWLECGFEDQVLRVDRIVNDRGVYFDVQLARRLLEETERNAWIACESIGKELGDWPAELVHEVASSPQQFALFTGAPNARKPTIEEMIKHGPDGPWGKEGWCLARARQAIVTIARGKLRKGLAMVSADGRLRDMHLYIGAHTWRWSGRGFQLQNMPRPEKRFEKWGDAEICALADAVLAGRHADPGEIDLLLRACIAARPGYGLAVCDFSGVEARANAWCAGDQVGLDTFASGVDPYCVEAEGIFGEPIDKHDVRRQAGKVSVLSCGYQGGPGALERMARGMGIDLEALGVSPAEVVSAWRDLHKPIVNSWYAYQRAFIAAAGGRASRVASFDFCPADNGEDVAIFFPMGGCIVYPKVEVRKDARGRPSISYEGHKDANEEDDDGDPTGETVPVREHIYGGLICENVIQRFCRDLMARALVAAEDAGLAPVMHVHDEIVCEVPAGGMREGFEHLKRVMLDLPDWAETFPIGAAGHFGLRYRK